MYHRKIGIFEDVFGDQITFEGSQNVTFSGEGGIQNLEGFVAFCSNDPAIETYKTEHRQFFDSLWNDALENVRVRPLGEYPRELLAGYGVSAEKLLEGSKATEKEIRLAPLPHQEKAVQGWLAHNRRGILDMCTGSGKSRAALMALETIEESPFTIVVTGNLTDLIDQWAENQIIPYYGRERVALLRISSVHGIRSRMELKLSEMVQDYRSGLYSAQKKRVFVLAAIQSASQLWFRSIIGRIPQSRLAIILDEVHHAGAPGPTGNVLEINADFRIGLSATWRRYDDDQNGKLESFFMGNGSAVAYSYPLSQGIHDKILSPYKYIIHPVTLDPSDAEQLRSQLDEYEKQLEKINPRLSLSEGDQVIEKTPKKKWRTLTQLRNGWRSTLTRAVAKTDVALQIVDADYSSLNKCIIYCANKQHLDRTSTLMGQMHWGIEPYDSQVSDSIRKKIREKFARQRGDKPLFIGAIKCLDEGIDLPALDSAILVSSNKTEREWIQRRGRILRRYPGKEYSTIHDLVMLPYTSKSDAFRLTKAELGYVESELNRLEAFSADSLNKTETQALIKDLRELYGIT
jgi:superfamily II DNA or RNA helicase